MGEELVDSLAHAPILRILTKPEKEITTRDWFFIGSELSRIRRDYKSSKLFGQHIATTDLGKLPASDRSDAKWLFENWVHVLEWLECNSAGANSDPFLELSQLGFSHPSTIRRKLRQCL